MKTDTWFVAPVPFSGKWSLVASRGSETYPLCRHAHDTPEEAQQCEEARNNEPAVTGSNNFKKEDLEFAKTQGVWRFEVVSPSGRRYVVSTDTFTEGLQSLNDLRNEQ